MIHTLNLRKYGVGNSYGEKEENLRLTGTRDDVQRGKERP